VISRKGWARLPLATAGEGAAPRYASLSHEREGILVLPSPPAGSHIRPDAPAGQVSADVPTPRPVRAQLDDVSRSYATPRGERVVLAGISRRFEAGTITGLVGRSGSGKTTLLHILAGLERASGGRVRVGGVELGSKSRDELAELRRKEIALVTQEPGLIPYLTPLENVMLGTRIRGAASGRASAALDQVGLTARARHPAANLSAGERARVAIARALAADVTLLLVDEPTARLDEANGLAVGRLLADAARRERLAVVCATHDPALIALMDATIELGGGIGSLDAPDVEPAPEPR
jgi:ABC-type lipoprotein export system ATPase subunit